MPSLPATWVVELVQESNPPPYEKLVGNLTVLYSRRINIQHRLVYKVNEELKVVNILRMCTRYD